MRQGAKIKTIKGQKCRAIYIEKAIVSEVVLTWDVIRIQSSLMTFYTINDSNISTPIVRNLYEHLRKHPSNFVTVLPPNAECH